MVAVTVPLYFELGAALWNCVHLFVCDKFIQIYAVQYHV